MEMEVWVRQLLAEMQGELAKGQQMMANLEQRQLNLRDTMLSKTMSTYGHVLTETQHEATTKVADLFGSPEPGPAPEEDSSDGEGSPDTAQPPPLTETPRHRR